jgi:hypothetical protein
MSIYTARRFHGFPPPPVADAIGDREKPAKSAPETKSPGFHPRYCTWGKRRQFESRLISNVCILDKLLSCLLEIYLSYECQFEYMDT